MQLDANADLTLKYRDEDGDLITLFDSADLAVAISYSRILKLTLFVNGRMSFGKSDKHIASEELIKELRSIRNRITEILDTLSDNSNPVGGITNENKNVQEAFGDLEVLNGKQLSGIKLESKEFDPLQKPVVNDDQLSVSSQSSSKVESMPPPPVTPQQMVPPPSVTPQQVAPPVASVPSATAAPAMNQPMYHNPHYAMAGYPGGPGPYPQG